MPSTPVSTDKSAELRSRPWSNLCTGWEVSQPDAIHFGLISNVSRSNFDCVLSCSFKSLSLMSVLVVISLRYPQTCILSTWWRLNQINKWNWKATSSLLQNSYWKKVKLQISQFSDYSAICRKRSKIQRNGIYALGNTVFQKPWLP